MDLPEHELWVTQEGTGLRFKEGLSQKLYLSPAWEVHRPHEGVFSLEVAAWESQDACYRGSRKRELDPKTSCCSL